MKYHLTILIIIFILSSPDVYSLSLQLKLTLDNTENFVYIPGEGEVASNTLGNKTFQNPKYYYLASYLNNILYALVFFTETPLSLSVENTSINHTLILSQEIENSNIFLVFTQGDWKSIENKISYIEAGEFLDISSPTFGFGFGIYRTILFLLNYPEFDIQQNRIIQTGKRRVIIDYVNYTDKPVINIEMMK